MTGFGSLCDLRPVCAAAARALMRTSAAPNNGKFQHASGEAHHAFRVAGLPRGAMLVRLLPPLQKEAPTMSQPRAAPCFGMNSG